MTARLAFEGAGEAADLTAFLGRLIRWDKAAVVRLRSAEGEATLGVFGHPPFGGVLAVRSAALGGAGVAAVVDATVSAGQLLDAVDVAATAEGELVVPASVTGPSWAGLLPPRGGWRRVGELDVGRLRVAAASIIGEFRTRTEALAPEARTRRGLDALAEELWARPLGGDGDAAGTGLTFRVVHAAHAVGFLRADDAVVLAAGPWIRLRTGYGSIAHRTASAASGLSVSPV